MPLVLEPSTLTYGYFNPEHLRCKLCLMRISMSQLLLPLRRLMLPAVSLEPHRLHLEAERISSSLGDDPCRC